MPRTLGIIAGGGSLPAQVAAAATAAGRKVFILALEGFAHPGVLQKWPHETVRLGAAGRIMAALREHGCEDVVLIGAVRRPSLWEMRPDAEGVRLLARIGKAAFAGDDGLLAALIKVLGEEGFQIVGAQDILCEAVAPAGLLTRATADAQALADIERARQVARTIGALDIGQACVVQQGLVLAVEAMEGTDAMLARCGALARGGPGGVLVKMVKPGQERRADLPAIGPQTVRNAAAAGLRGIAYEAGGAIIADRDATIAEADKAGLFLLGITADEELKGRDNA